MTNEGRLGERERDRGRGAAGFRSRGAGTRAHSSFECTYVYQASDPVENRRPNKRRVFDDEDGDASPGKVLPENKKFKTDESEEKPEASFVSKGEYHKDANLKSWRLIIRNIPWKTKKEDVQNVCSNFGPFTEVVLPPSKKIEGTCAGFGFIQFKKKEDAEKAREHFNTNKFLGRMIAADWALAKDTYETSAQEERDKIKQLVKAEKTEDVNPNTRNKQSKSKDKKKKPTEAIKEEKLSESEDEDDAKPNAKGKSKKDDVQANKPMRADKAMEEGRVVFLRNLSFETTEDAVKKEMERFGTVKVALICKFKDSGHSKGTAFVHFATAGEASACISAAEDGFLIDNRLVRASAAIPRVEAVAMEKERLAKTPKDNRNLRLLRFALIRDGTTAARGMSKEDAAKREKLAEAARKKLENSNMFVSPTRLCIHNMPQRIDDAALHKLVRDSTTGAKITECRVWLDKTRVNAEGKPKSTGFGFIAFAEHNHAMECLQALNNNPETFSDERRPIVEFSIENICALQAKARRSSKNKGETTSDKQLSEKIRKQVKSSIGEVHAAGMKFLPKFLGKKNRHRDLTGKAKRNVQARAKAKALKHNKEATSKANEAPKKKKSKKDVSKYLTLSA